MSVDRDMDVEAEYVLVRPRCGLHDVDLENIGSGMRMSLEDLDPEDGTWYGTDTSELGCPVLGEELKRHERVTVVHARQVDNLMDKDSESHYFQVQIMIREPK